MKYSIRRLIHFTYVCITFGSPKYSKNHKERNVPCQRTSLSSTSSFCMLHSVELYHIKSQYRDYCMFRYTYLRKVRISQKASNLKTHLVSFLPFRGLLLVLSKTAIQPLLRTSFSLIANSRSLHIWMQVNHKQLHELIKVSWPNNPADNMPKRTRDIALSIAVHGRYLTRHISNQPVTNIQENRENDSEISYFYF